MYMKKSFYYVLALFMLCACSSGSDDPAAEPEERYYTSDVEHLSYQLGFKSGEEGNLYESNSYAAIAIGESWNMARIFVPSVVKEPDARRLVYSYDTEERYFTWTHEFYAYYSVVVEWDSYSEFKEYDGVTQTRDVIKNLKCTVTYKGCTSGTPSQYIPNNTAPEVTTYPDTQSQWVVINSGSNPGVPSPGNDNPVATKEYSYHSKTTCYHQNGDSDNLYIYKKGTDYRASWVYSAKGLDKVATEKIYSGINTINGVQYSYYIQPFGLTYCFNFNK